MPGPARVPPRAGTGHRKHDPEKLPAGDDPGELPPTRVEVLRPSEEEQPATETGDEEGYPVKYRTLVREYFRRVAEDSQAGGGR